MWVFNRGIWCSTDGINWTKEAGSVPGSSQSFLVFKNKLWALESSIYNGAAGVWYTDNGKDWTKATDNAGWGKRSGYTAIAYNNKIWVMGGRRNTIGLNDFESLNDIWNTENGVNWKKVSQKAEWETRHDAPAVVYKGKIWIVAGSHYGSDGKKVEALDDVWYYSEPTSISKHKTVITNQEVLSIGNVWESYVVHIDFNLKHAMRVSLAIYSSQGKKVTTLLNRMLQKGQHTIAWNKRDACNESVAKGNYFLHITSNNKTVTEKIVILNN